MRRDPLNGQAVQSFYIVTPFWNLKRVLAPSTRCYYHGYRQRQCPLPPHTRANRQSDCGSGTATAIDGCQSSQMVWGPEACLGGSLASMSSQIRAILAQDLAPIDSHHVAHDSRGQEPDQQLTFLLLVLSFISADNGGRTTGPSIDEGSSNVPDLAATLPASLRLPEEAQHHALILAARPAFKQTRRLSSLARPRRIGSPRSQPPSHFCFALMRSDKRGRSCAES